MTVPILATVTLAAASGLPEDSIVNDWSFNAADVTGGVLDGIAASIISFYNTDNTVRPVGELLGRQLSRASNRCQVDFFNLTGHLDGTPHGSPIHINSFTLVDAGASQEMPSEVAIVLSFSASGFSNVPEQQVNPSPPPAKIRPRSRYRGRIYLGPLTNLSVTNDENFEPRLNTTALGDINVAINRFLDERPDFGVWSRADEVIRPVLPNGAVYIDNAFDTQRRRGHAPSLRTGLFP